MCFANVEGARDNVPANFPLLESGQILCDYPAGRGFVYQVTQTEVTSLRRTYLPQ